jgi:hypothetical protein
MRVHVLSICLQLDRSCVCVRVCVNSLQLFAINERLEWELGPSLSPATVLDRRFVRAASQPASLAGDLRVPSPPTAASPAGGGGNRRSRPVHSAGLGRPSAGGAMEEKVVSVEVLVSVCVPSRGGALRSFVAPRLTSSRPPVFGSVGFAVPRPVPWWRGIRMLKEIKEKMALTPKATATTFRRVGSLGPAIGDFPAASGLAPIQGVKRSSGSGASPTAPARCPRRDLEEGVTCNFLFCLGLSVRTLG